MRPGQYNPFYQIPYVIGERVREWDSLSTILNDSPSLINWGYTNNIDYKGNLWVADSEKHVIYLISKEQETINAKFKIAGTEG